MIRPWLCGVMTGVCAGIAVLHLPLAALDGWPLRNAAAFAVAALAWLILAAIPTAPKES